MRSDRLRKLEDRLGRRDKWGPVALWEPNADGSYPPKTDVGERGIVLKVVEAGAALCAP